MSTRYLQHDGDSVKIARLMSASHEHVQKLWQSDRVCCCFVSRKNPEIFLVQVCVDGKPFLEEFVKSSDAAITVGEQLWGQYADPKTPRD